MDTIKYKINYETMIGGCPKGTILRRSYVTKTGKKVGATCIKDRGQPGKGPYSLPPLDKKISLSRFGYTMDRSSTNRQRALVKAINDYKKKKNLNRRNAALKVLRRVVLISNYNKSNERVSNKMKKDVKFLQKRYFRK